MAQLTITFISPSNGDDIETPYEATGTAVGGQKADGSGQALINLVAMQIDSGMPLQLFPPGAAAVTVSFSIPMTEVMLPAVDTAYLLTVYAWDEEGDCAEIGFFHSRGF